MPAHASAGLVSRTIPSAVRTPRKEREENVVLAFVPHVALIEDENGRRLRRLARRGRLRSQPLPLPWESCCNLVFMSQLW